MSLPEFCIKRPVFTVVMSLVILALGTMSGFDLNLRWIPDVTPAQVSIVTSYSGASPQLIENEITRPLENALAGVDGIDTVISRSRQSTSQIDITFEPQMNVDLAVDDLRSHVGKVNNTLPKNAEQPVIAKADPSSIPVIFFTYSDTKKTTQQLTDYVKRFVQPELEAVKGVGDVTYYGARNYAVRIWLDPQKLAARGVTADEVYNVLKTQNVQVPSGRIKTDNRYYTVLTNEKLQSLDDIEKLIIRQENNHSVRLSDVATIALGSEDEDNTFRFNGELALALGVIPQSNANPLQVAKDVLQRDHQLRKSLPNGMQVKVVFNQATFISASIKSVLHSILEAVLLVILVIALFLGRLRSALIPIVTIPVCLIGGFSFIYLLGYTINTITLLAMVLAIGLVVDDAIVVVENVTRHIESGKGRLSAALIGSKEMVFPVVGMTLTLAAVYIPVGFAQGVVGQFFREFAFTLAGCVLISGFVALTLSPMLCATLLRVGESKSSFGEFVERWSMKLNHGYKKVLTFVLEKRIGVVILLVAIGVSCGMLYRSLPSELAPVEDMGAVNIFIASPDDASFKYTDHIAKEVEKLYPELPGFSSYLINVGSWSPKNSFSMVKLKDWKERDKSSTEVAKLLTEKTDKIPGANIYVQPPLPPISWFSDDSGNNFSLAVMTTGSYKELYDVMQVLKDRVKDYPGFTYVDSRLRWDTQLFEIKVDREKAAVLQIPIENINANISAMLSGMNVTDFEYNSENYKVILQMNEQALSNPNLHDQFYVRNREGQMIPLSDVASIEQKTFPNRLSHIDRMRSDVLSISLKPGYSMAEVIDYLSEVAHEVLPENMKYEFLGSAKEYLKSSHVMMMAFLLGLLFIYLTLAAQFESFIDPFIILLTVPFAMFGALLTLKLTGLTLNIYSNIGLVTLIGLIAKHGILITEFANNKRKEGMALRDAIIEASSLRLRPILMTTLAMVFGALPLALATGPGAETRQQIGWVVVGGMSLGTFFSLFVIPVAYSYLGRLKREPELEPLEENPTLSPQG